MGDIGPMAGFFHLNKPERDHAEQVLHDELSVIEAGIVGANRRRDAALQELYGVNQALENLNGRKASIQRLLKVSLTQQGGTA